MTIAVEAVVDTSSDLPLWKRLGLMNHIESLLAKPSDLDLFRERRPYFLVFTKECQNAEQFLMAIHERICELGWMPRHFGGHMEFLSNRDKREMTPWRRMLRAIGDNAMSVERL